MEKRKLKQLTIGVAYEGGARKRLVLNGDRALVQGDKEVLAEVGAFFCDQRDDPGAENGEAEPGVEFLEAEGVSLDESVEPEPIVEADAPSPAPADFPRGTLHEVEEEEAEIQHDDPDGDGRW